MQSQLIKSTLKILLVEDDEDILELYKIFLENQSLEISTANNGIQALILVKKIKFDLILSDISMPEMTGVEFLEQLRTFDSTTPFIFISAYGHQQQTLLKSNLNISDFLVKPVREPAFLKTVRKFLKLDPALDLPLVK